MNEEELQQWESTYHALMAEMDGYTEDIEQRLNTVSSMADRLNDWRIDESYGECSKTWQKLKRAALAKKKELGRIWARRHGGGEGQSSRGITDSELKTNSQHTDDNGTNERHLQELCLHSPVGYPSTPETLVVPARWDANARCHIVLLNDARAVFQDAIRFVDNGKVVPFVKGDDLQE